MCKLKSAIILKDRIFMPDYDSHSKMLEELGITDDYLGASKKFVRAELSPTDGDVFSNVDTWVLNVDQDITPEWFDADEQKPRMIEAVKAWAKDHIHVGVEGLQISAGENHYIKDCKNVEIYGSATVKYICGSATVKNIYDSATVKYICDSATVKNIYDSATVNYICGSATVNYIYGSATVKNIYGSATVKNSGDCSVIFSSPYVNWENSSTLILTENATFKDNRTRTIYQSGYWKLVEVKNGKACE